MLTCVTRSKQHDEHDESNQYIDSSAGKQLMKSLTSQIKDMALKASGAYRNCTPCAPQQHLHKSNDTKPESSASVSEKVRWPYRRNGSKNSSSGRVWGKEMEARLKGISMGSGGGSEAATRMLSTSVSGRRYEPVVLVEESEPKEWVAQVEPGVLITFVSLPRGGNDLKRIRFSRDMFNKWQAQKWWQENFEKVMELYNVRRLNRQAFPLPTPPKSEDELALNSRNPKIESTEDSPLAPPIIQLDHQDSTITRSNNDSFRLTITPKLSNISCTLTETSSICANSPREVNCGEERSISKVSDVDNEWVEQVEPGVYITIKALPGGSRELRRVRFSREKFGEVLCKTLVGGKPSKDTEAVLVSN